MSKLVLGIESSCDETAAAVLADGRRVRREQPPDDPEAEQQDQPEPEAAGKQAAPGKQE